MAKKNMSNLTHQRLIETLDYDPKTGVFGYVAPTHFRRRHGEGEIGTIAANGRRYITIDRRMYLAHRLAWFHVNGQWPENNLIPADGDYLNMRLGNWSQASASIIARQAKDRSDNQSGARGTYYDEKRRKWVAGITINYVRRPLGRFDTKEEAQVAYEKAREALPSAASIADPVALTARRERVVERARYRHLYNRALRTSGGVMGWASFDAFIADLRTVEWKHNREIAAIDQLKPIGPGNWQWEDTLHSRFDTRTPEGKTAYSRAHRDAYPMLYRDKAIERDFGIPLAEYQRMFVEQKGVCGSCSKPETEMRGGKVRWLAVDHCHDTGEIRGLLCGNCNRGVGCFADDTALLQNAIDYLNRHATKKAAGLASNVIPLKRKDQNP